jgi:transposase
VERPMSIPAVVDEIEKRFGIRVHRRSLERALHRYEKKTLRTAGEKKRQGQ